MKIRIRSNEKNTSLIVDGTEISRVTSGFSLSQKAGEIPVLVVEIPVPNGDIDVELPEGVVIIEKMEGENETKRNSVDASD